MFALPLSQMAFNQVLNIQQKMESAVLDEHNNDVWTYPGGASKYKSGKAYRMLLGHHAIDPAFK